MASTSFPTLTGATISVDLANADDETFTTTGTALSASEAQVELTAAQTSGLRAGIWTYALKATLTDGHVITLATGNLLGTAGP